MPRKRKSESLTQARVMKAYVERNCTKDLKLADLSRTFCYSEDHIGRIFKAQLGLSFVDCLTQARIRRAKRLLSQTHLPAYEIAVRAGFNHRDYFFKVFRKTVGQTPRTYRLSHR